MNFSSLILLVLAKASIIFCQNQFGLQIVRQWNQLDFVFPTPQAQTEAIRRKLFVPENNTPIDVDVDYRGSLEESRIFVTIPRFSTGVPITLGYVKSPANDLKIRPYPDYSWHSSNGANCNFITSVVRVAIDSCHQLWVLDTGVVAEERKCPPQLLVFNLNNDQLIRRFKFPRTQYSDRSLFITPVLDVQDFSGRCDNTKVYIADVTGFGLIVYDTQLNRSWRIENKLFFPYPNFGTFTIRGESFDLMDGLFGLALSPKKSTDASNNFVFGGPFRGSSERFLYFHALASGHENSVPLRLINNASIWDSNASSLPREFRVIGRRGIQTAAQAMDSNGNLFFVMMDPIALACWDSSTRYSAENIRILQRNEETLQFASGLKIVTNLKGQEELWVLTNRFQKIAAGTLNRNELNFRIQNQLVSVLLNGNTKCSNNIPNVFPFMFPTRFGNDDDAAEN